MRPWKLAETNYGYVKEHLRSGRAAAGRDRAAQPAPALRHRMLRSRPIGEQICEAARERGAKVVLLPTIPYGTETNQMAFPLAMNVNPVDAGRRDHRPGRFAGAARHPQDRALNSHGGNDLKPVLRELHGRRRPTVSVQLVSRAGGHRRRDFRRGRRSCRRDGNVADPGLLIRTWSPATPTARWRPTTAARRPSRFEAVNRGWVSITRPWHLLTTNSGGGNPHAATAEKGRRMMEMLVERLAAFLVELSAAPLDERFPY